MALIKSRKLNDPNLALAGHPNPGMLIPMTDSLSGKTKMTSLKEAVLYSGVYFDNDNYKGEFLPDSPVPENTDNKPIWGYVFNATTEDAIFVNFPTDELDENGNPIPVKLSPNTSGKLVYNGNYWSFAPDLDNVNYILAQMGMTIIENNEYAYAILDSEQKILFGIKTDGSIYIPAGMPEDVSKALANLSALIDTINNTLSGIGSKTDYLSVIQNQEFVYAIEDAANRVIFGVRSDGTTYIPAGIPDQAANALNKLFVSIDSINSSIDTINGILPDLQTKASYISIIQNAEFVYAIVDAGGKLLFGIRNDGTIQDYNTSTLETVLASIGNVKQLMDTVTDNVNGLLAIFSQYSDLEGRIEVKVDKDGKVLSSRDKAGVLHEEVGIEAKQVKLGRLLFSGSGMTDLIADLKAAGIQTGKGDQSDADLVQLPRPTVISYINFDIDSSELPHTTDESIEVHCNAEYWDPSGNYFKKPVILATQGNSSSQFYRKNYSFDIADGSELKFGNFSASDSYHLKGYYEDAFRGKEIPILRLFKEVLLTRQYEERYAFYDQYKAPSLFNGIGDLQFDSNSVANYVPDGFPVAVYCKGEFWGCYVIKQKKERDNMDIKKKDLDHVWIDGAPGDGSLGKLFFTNAEIPWAGVPIKNPSGLIDIDGNDYDDDYPKELSDTDSKSATVKTIIEAFGGCVTYIDAEATDADKKTKWLSYFDLNSMIDYYLYCNVVHNSDWVKNAQWYTKNAGAKWAVAVWDLNLIFGLAHQGNCISEGITSAILLEDTYSPFKYLRTLFATELLARYTQLRKQIYTTDHIIDLLRGWLNEVTFNKLSDDLELWPETPSYRDGKINRDYWECVGLDGTTALWDESTAYSVGNQVGYILSTGRYRFKCVQANTGEDPVTGSYDHYPQDCGFYDSIDRVKQTLDARFLVFDAAVGYSN